MKIIATDEAGRYLVPSKTDGDPWLVDLSPGDDLPRCACAIQYSRTVGNWHCQHVQAVLQWLRWKQGERQWVVEDGTILTDAQVQKMAATHRLNTMNIIESVGALNRTWGYTIRSRTEND